MNRKQKLDRNSSDSNLINLKSKYRKLLQEKSLYQILYEAGKIDQAYYEKMTNRKRHRYPGTIDGNSINLESSSTDRILEDTGLINLALYGNRCKCKEEFLIKKKKKRKPPKRREKSSLPYPSSDVSLTKTFQIKYEKKLSSIAKFTLNSFRNKYFYYAIDDILYLLRSNPIERENLLAILYSPVLSLHNNLSISFFDIWIDEIYINEISKVNKFLINNFQNREQFNYITIKLLYKTRVPVKKQEPFW